MGISLTKHNSDKVRDFTIEWVKLSDVKHLLINHRKCMTPINKGCYDRILNSLEGGN